MDDKKTKQTLYTCDECKTVHSDLLQYNNHTNGKKHRQNIAKHAQILHEAATKLYATRGVYVGNLPPNTRPNDIRSFVGAYGEIEESVFGRNFAMFRFADEQSATNFRTTKHNFQNQTLKTNHWIKNPPLNPRTFSEDKNQLVINAVSNTLASDMSFDQEMVTLQGQLLPYDLVTRCNNQMCTDISRALRPLYASFTINPFGSMVTGLAFKGSDLDVLVDTTFTLQRYKDGYGNQQDFFQQSCQVEQSELRAVANALKENRFIRIMPIFNAKVPIVKCLHCPTMINCDISFKNVTAVQNSHLIWCYISLDVRVKPLLIILKYWAKYFGLTRSCLSSYALVMIVLFYLMQLDDPILPPVSSLQKDCLKRLYVDGWNCSFNDSYSFEPSKNTSSILDLLQGFFEYYSRFDYGFYVLCPLIGKALPKVFFQHMERLPPEMSLYQLNCSDAQQGLCGLKIGSNICVQDPFILDFNVTKAIGADLATRIQALCMSSAYVLKEDRGKNGTTGILKHLLQKRTGELALVPSLWNKSLSNNVEIQIKVGTYIPSVEPEASVKDAQNIWYNIVFDEVVNIYERICKFATDEDTSSPNKKKKEEIVDDADNSDLDDTPRIIICKSAGPDLRSNRKQVTKELNSTKTPTMSFIEMQEAVSRHMMEQEGPIETVEFKCCFHMLKDPTHVVLEFSDIASSERVFNSWAQYLEAHLPGWINNVMNT